MKTALLMAFVGILGLTQTQIVERNDDAEVKVAKAPKSVKEGQSFTLEFAAKNIGANIWRREHHYYALGVGNPGRRIKRNPTGFQIASQEAAGTADGNRIMLKDNEEVKAGQTKRFKATFSHTLKVGERLEIDARMVREGTRAEGWLDGWFGSTASVTIKVVR